jgi:hypothetical protein
VSDEELLAAGWRKCAEGQRETQFCALLEAAVKAEREACARICDSYALPDGVSLTGLKLAATIRKRK